MLIFDDFDGYHPKAGPYCMACEAMLADAVDETLGEVDKTWFDRHIATCTVCAERFANAQRGSAWLEMLKTTRPEPGADLMARILAKTAELPVPQPKVEVKPVRVNNSLGGMVVPFPMIVQPKAPWRMLLEPQMAMTAAMAFFSIALTMNLTGIHVNQLSANDLRPESLQRTYYNVSTKAVRYYDNLRVVHVMESRVEDIQEAQEARQHRLATQQDSQQEQPKAEPQGEPPIERKADPAAPKQEKKPEAGGGISWREEPVHTPGVSRVLVEQNSFKGWARSSLVAAVLQLNLAGGLG